MVSVEQVGSLDELVVFTKELVLKESFGLFGTMKSISQSCKDGMNALRGFWHKPRVMFEVHEVLS